MHERAWRWLRLVYNGVIIYYFSCPTLPPFAITQQIYVCPELLFCDSLTITSSIKFLLSLSSLMFSVYSPLLFTRAPALLPPSTNATSRSNCRRPLKNYIDNYIYLFSLGLNRNKKKYIALRIVARIVLDPFERERKNSEKGLIKLNFYVFDFWWIS